MADLSMYLSWTVGLLAVCLTLVYWLWMRSFGYWKRRGVFSLEPSFPFGNMKDTAIFVGVCSRRYQGYVFREFYNATAGHKYVGLYNCWVPMLMVRDPETIKEIMTKDYRYFTTRGLFTNGDYEAMNYTLFFEGGHHWKQLRTLSGPAFTSGKLKRMFHLMKDCAHGLASKVETACAESHSRVHLKEYLKLYMTDIIGACIFGLEINSLADPNTDFRRMGAKFFDPDFMQLLRFSIVMFAPSLARMFRIHTTPDDITRYFKRLVTDIVAEREANNVRRNDFMDILIQLKNLGVVEADEKEGDEDGVADVNDDSKSQDDKVKIQIYRLVVETPVLIDDMSVVGLNVCLLCVRNNVRRNDFIDILIQLKNHGVVEADENEGDGVAEGDGSKRQDDKVKVQGMGLDQVVASAFSFFAAGFETSSAILNFCLYELALAPDVQAKVRNEVDAKISGDGNITYEALAECTYMDKVLFETMRKYPVLALLTRKCTETYRIAGTGDVIEKGTRVLIPVYALHFDPQIFPDPERFLPERFDEEVKRSRHPYTYLPFGDGPRMCIGNKFAMLQLKLGLTTLLSRMEFTLAPEVPVPLKMKSQSFVTAAIADIFLQITLRSQ